ncbi:MAG: acyl carrier protein [Thermoleophilia bacterium]|nr:acyl carrier protein [Thermoleophilia bacterium]
MASFRDQVSAVMYAAVSAAMGVPVEGLADGTELIAGLGAKSVNFVRIIAALEEEFDLEVPFMQFRRQKSIGEAIDYVVRLSES